MRRKSWLLSGGPSTSTVRPNRFGKKAMFCVWWVQKGVIYYGVLKHGETVNAERYQQKLIKKYKISTKRSTTTLL